MELNSLPSIDSEDEFFIAKEPEPVATITLGDIADKLKELLADRDVEAVIACLPYWKLEVKRYSEVEPDDRQN